MIHEMTTELVVLFMAVILGGIQLGVATAAKMGQTTLDWTVGARDQAQSFTGVPARLDRAYHNFMETFPFFMAAILMVHAAGKEGDISSSGAYLYLICRVIYVPLYALGVPYGRTLVWGASIAGLLMVMIACFVPT